MRLRYRAPLKVADLLAPWGVLEARSGGLVSVLPAHVVVLVVVAVLQRRVALQEVVR
jgi:hypothetical protein